MLILQSEIHFKHSVVDASALGLIGTDKGYTSAHEFNSIRESELEEHFTEIMTYSKREKNPVRGSFIVRDEDGNFRKYKLTGKGFSNDLCSVSIKVRSEKERKKQPTFAEKMEMLRKYVADYHHLPDSTVVVNDVKIGVFVKKLMTDEEHVNEFNQIRDAL